jgi:hypothetical protein
MGRLIGYITRFDLTSGGIEVTFVTSGKQNISDVNEILGVFREGCESALIVHPSHLVTSVVRDVVQSALGAGCDPALSE